jgi:hypothetical protein|tara:strand:+ start:1693 stop:1839 length:147 start_codon:yes stop_codon:yes gene_type:complete
MLKKIGSTLRSRPSKQIVNIINDQNALLRGRLDKKENRERVLWGYNYL